MGCAVTEWLIDKYNDTGRWNILSVGSLASAAGGSPLATLANYLDIVLPGTFRLVLGALWGLDSASFTQFMSLVWGSVFDPLIDPLTARNTSVVDHNDMNGTIVYVTAGHGIWKLLPLAESKIGSILSTLLMYNVDAYLGVRNNDFLVPYSSGFMRNSYANWGNSGNSTTRYSLHYMRPGWPDYSRSNYHHMEIGGEGVPAFYQTATPYQIPYLP